MADRFSTEKRSEIMARIRSKNTKPELRIRSALHRLGYRFRLHRADLPGTPDIVLPKFRAVVQVRGCFWHGHDCSIGHTPRSNAAYWGPKIERNKARDERNDAALHDTGWKVIEIWECQCRGAKCLAAAISVISHQLGARRLT